MKWTSSGGRCDIPLVLVTHDLDDVVRLATHLLVLDKGRAVANGPLQTLMSRPDLPWLRDVIGVGSLLDAEVAQVHSSRGLVELAFDGGAVLAPADSLAVGRKVRLRIPAREVILARKRPEGLSLRNTLAGVVSAVHADAASPHVTVQVAVGRALILAEVTSDAAAELEIVVGVPIFALVKSVSIDVLN